jgi:hypothetical protein
MRVERYDHNGYDIEVRNDGEYVKFEDFDTVHFALRTIHASCEVFLKRNPTDTTATVIRNHLQKIIDQYE